MTCENCESLEQEIQCLEEEACMNDDENMRLNKEIERLRAENEALRKASEWQPITEDEHGLLIIPHDEIVHLSWWCHLRKEWQYETCKFSTGNGFQPYSQHADATHWMPLPQPPKEQSE